MRTLVAILLLSAAARAQQAPLADRLRTAENRLADLRRRFSREAEGTNEKQRLQLELRIQNARVKEFKEEQEKVRTRLEDLNAKLASEPDHAESVAARGVAHRQLGDVEAAERDFSRAIKLKPSLEARLAHLRISAKAPPKMRPEMERIRAYVEENEPETYYRLLALQKEGKRTGISRMLRDAEVRMRELNKLKQRNPQAYGRRMAMRDLEREALGLAVRARGAGSSERASIESQLSDVLSRLFDLREEFRAEEFDVLRGRIAGLENALDGRKARKSEIIEKRKRELFELTK